MEKDELLDWLHKEWKRNNSRKEIRRRKRAMFDFPVGLEMWNRIKADPTHPFHEMQKRQIRRNKLLYPFRQLRRWFRRVTGIERRENEKWRKQIWGPIYTAPSAPPPPSALRSVPWNSK